MKKLLTFCAALLAVVSLWGTDYTIGDGTVTCYNSPLTTSIPNGYLTTNFYKCFTQQLYLASELTAQGATAGTITGIQFYSNTYASSSGSVSTVRTDFKVYIATTTSTTLTSYISEKGTEVYSSTSLTIESGKSFVGTLKTNFSWNGTDNIIVTVVDNSGNKTGGKNTGFKAFTASNRGVYKRYESGYNINFSDATTPLTEIPQITFTFGGSTPEPETPHVHNNITFTKWDSDNSLPTTAGNYYLNKNVTVNGWKTPTGTTNLCLNGKTISLGENIIDVDATLNIYDCEGGGKITSTKSSSVTDGTIKVEYNGTLSLSSGTIENTGTGTYSYAILVNGGTFNLSGAPILSGKVADISLYQATYKITIAGAITQPASPYKVKTSGSTITSGWSTYMSAADPTQYFASTTAGKSTAVINGEVNFISAISISDEADNFTTLNTNKDKTVDVNMTRTFSNASYNTICLPFALTAEQIPTVFGAETKVQKLTSSDLSDNGMTLTLGFEEVTAMEAGQPYLIQPANEVANPTFNSVTIAATTPSTLSFDDDHVKFIGTFGKTSITAGTKDILFLSANNELVWAEAGIGDLKGMRAYFHITYPGASKIGACRVSMGRNATTAVPSLDARSSSLDSARKEFQNGQLVIIQDGKRYSIYGQPIQ